MGPVMVAIKIRAGFGMRAGDEVGDYSHLAVLAEPWITHSNSRSFLTTTKVTGMQAFGQVLVSLQEALHRCGK